MFGGDHKVKRLEQIPMLSQCSARELKAVAARGDMLAVRSGDVVRYNGRDRSFLLLLSGSATRGEGVLEPGDSYGAVGLLGGQAEKDEVRMLTDGRVLVVGPREFSALIYSVPGFALGLAKDLARRAE